MKRPNPSQPAALNVDSQDSVSGLDGIGFGYRPRARYACDPAASRGRLWPEPESPTRTPFQRDRDRIIHSTAFRRLKHKTQVFIAHEGDHYRTRLTHTIEVAQIARALARAFRADEDLAEAIALVHDFGHTPFGHTGEDALADCMKAFGGFDHNEQALRVVTKLERRYAEFDGLNLTWETLEGLVKHNGPLADASGRGLKGAVPASIRNYNQLQDLQIDQFASIEAQCAALADDIAYDAHDIDDGLRSGLLTLEMLDDAPLPAEILRDVAQKYPQLDAVRRGHELVRRQITRMVEDVIVASKERLAAINPGSADEIRNAGRPVVIFSGSMAGQEKTLKAFLYQRLYRNPTVMQVREGADRIVRDLFVRYLAEPNEMPEGWRAVLGRADEAVRARHVADYLAGMTDHFALKEHNRLFDHTPDLG